MVMVYTYGLLMSAIEVPSICCGSNILNFHFKSHTFNSLFIADSVHHQLIITNTHYTVQPAQSKACVLCAVCCVLCAVCCVLCDVCCVLCAVGCRL